MFEDINFGEEISKKIIDFNINKSLPLEEQLEFLKEDLLQVVYENNYLIDVGWYPEFEKDGHFVISVIKSCQWNQPIYQKCCNNLDVLKTYLLESIELIKSSKIQ